MPTEVARKSHTVAVRVQHDSLTRFPADYSILTRLREYEFSEPPATVDVISVDVSCGEVREVHQLGGKCLLRLHNIMRV